MRNERQTRKEIIDVRLKESGWNVDDPMWVNQEFPIPYTGMVAEPEIPYGTQYSDYVLLGANGKPLAVVEAKKTSKDAAIGREQAKQYCYNIRDAKGCELPFCFYTNGHDIYFWNLENYPPVKVLGFPTRDDLERYAYLRKSRKPLAKELINPRIAGRDYQIAAIRKIMEAIDRRKRRFLLVMATGTGKIRTCIALVDALMRAGWIERTLFLVDRVALRDQAADAFKEHLPDDPRWTSESDEIETGKRIYISTYMYMLNQIRKKDNPLSPHFFDLVVVDESHRSIYNTYQEVLGYFNTLTLGLTATPTDAIDHNTFTLFDEEDGDPTHAFSYQEAVEHIPPYLCDFHVIRIRTRFQEQGININTISLEDQKRMLREGTDPAQFDYDGNQLEKTEQTGEPIHSSFASLWRNVSKTRTGYFPVKPYFSAPPYPMHGR